MRIQGNEILFDQPPAFLSFIYELELIGLVQLSRPVEDLSGKVMIREKILVRQSMLQRIGEATDQFKLPIALEITEEIIKRIRNSLAEAILKQIDRPEHVFLNRLYSDLKKNPRPIILHSFRHRPLALLAYQIARQKPDLFTNLTVLGLLCLGIVIQKEYKIPLVHRHAFLAGFCCQLGLADTDDWRQAPKDDEEQRRRLERSAAYLDQMNFVQGLGTVLRSSFFSVRTPAVIDQTFTGLLQEFKPGPDAEQTEAAQPQQQADADVEEEPTATPEVVDNAAVPVLIGTVRIARFAHDIINSPTAQVNSARELVQGLAYNTAKGYFEKTLVIGSLGRFREYEVDIKHLAALAQVEGGCIHGGRYAWAYPKPRATQVLCSENLFACPHIKTAWTFHLVAPQRAYGRIGRNLPAGTYHKCALEEDLPPSPSTQSKKSSKLDLELEPDPQVEAPLKAGVQHDNTTNTQTAEAQSNSEYE